MKQKTFIRSFILSFFLSFLAFSSFATVKPNPDMRMKTALLMEEKAVVSNDFLKPMYWSALLPCPEGMVGEGTYFWKIYDDVTGEIFATGTIDYGCFDPIEP